MNVDDQRLADELYERLLDRAEKTGWKGTRRLKVLIQDVEAGFRALPAYLFEDEQARNVARLAAVLEVMERDGLLVALRDRHLEDSRLPKGVWLQPITEREGTGPAPKWHPRIGYLDGSWPRATAKQRAAYVAVDRWLKSDPDLRVVPIRERALEVFGTFGDEEFFPVPEKTLDDLRSGPLFKNLPEVRSVLRAFDVPPPLLSEAPVEEVGDGYFSRIGQGDLLLVVENSATWHSVVSWLRGDHDVGAVAWGLGRAFTRSIASLSERHRISRIRYFGDLDPSGLDIPTKAAVYARELGLPEIQPAARLYRALLSVGRDRPGTEKPMTPSGAAALASWLPEDCRLTAADTLVAGRRIAQEWVGYRYLQQNDDWLIDLGGESASDAPGGDPL